MRIESLPLKQLLCLLIREDWTISYRVFSLIFDVLNWFGKANGDGLLREDWILNSSDSLDISPAVVVPKVTLYLSLGNSFHILSRSCRSSAGRGSNC